MAYRVFLFGLCSALNINFPTSSAGKAILLAFFILLGIPLAAFA
tara:strand:+ start:605 stop:736 length:132 start_codon:yes stop_codon:yes gene_type:complete